jgi:hypothetical protein
MTETRRIRGAQKTTETELGDYEKVGGVYFPMSVDSWDQGQSNQRTRIIVDTATANPPVTPAMFAEPSGAAQPAKAGGPPPDASNKPAEKSKADQPPEKPENPPKPSKGE